MPKIFIGNYWRFIRKILIYFFWFFLRHQRGYAEEDAEFIKQALAMVPDYTDAHNNLGNIY